MPHRDGRTRPRWRLLPLITVAAAAVAYLPVMVSLLALWRADRYYAYLGFVIPIFILLLWTSRDRWSGTAPRGHDLGILLCLLALGLLVLGRSSSSLHMQALSLVVAVAGVGACVRGSAWARAAGYPLTFLLFLVPIPRGAIDAVTLDLQRLLARCSGMLLAATGVPVRIDEIAIHLPTLTLQIVEGCNGLSFLLALVVVVGGAAGILVPSLWERVGLIALAVPAALTANVMRITGTGLSAHWLGPEAAADSHAMLGKAIWGFTTIILIVLAWRLGRRATRAPALEPARVLSRAQPPSGVLR